MSSAKGSPEMLMVTTTPIIVLYSLCAMPDSMLLVKDVMQAEPVSVQPNCAIRDALTLMNELRIGAVLVIDTPNELVGIFTERDILRRITGASANWTEQPVSSWMTHNPHTVQPDREWIAASLEMERLRVRHLPVVEDGRVVGLVSTRGLMQRQTAYLNQLIENRTTELRHANDELMARDADLRQNLRAAGRLQIRLMLPHNPPDWPELHWGVYFAPLDHLGGDYYDIATPAKDHLGFLIADASGHSIAAAMVAIMSRFAFTEVSGRVTSPGTVLMEMNQRLQGLADERFVTAFYGIFDRQSRVFTYANAGHPYPLRWVAATGQVISLAAQGFMLGIMPEEQYRESCLQLALGDRLCFYTDGLFEARNEIGEAYGTQRLIECIRTHGAKPAKELLVALLKSLNDFRGSQPLNDDITVVIVELTAAGATSTQQSFT